MSASNRIGQWIVSARWLACFGAAAMIAISFLMFQPARAQDGGPAAKAPAEKAPAEKAPAEPAGKAARTEDLTPQEAERLFEARMREKEPAKGDAKPLQADNAATEEFNIFEVVQKGGVHMWAVYAILAVSLVTGAFAIERVFGLRRKRVLPPELMTTLRALAAQKGGFDPRQAYRLCRQYPSSAATVLKTMLMKVGRPMGEIERAVAEASDREASRLYANVRWQNLAFNLAPMLGLAGTVHGVILAFFVTAKMPVGVSKMESLATGIYAALICTFAGLVVAIPAGVLAHVFEGRIMNLFRELDDLVLALLPQLERFEGRPRPGKANAEKAAAPVAAPAANGEPAPEETVIEPVSDKWTGAN